MRKKTRDRFQAKNSVAKNYSFPVQPIYLMPPVHKPSIGAKLRRLIGRLLRG